MMQRALDKLYLKYEPLAVTYAKRVFNAHRISFEREDVIQDFKAKLFTSIVSYVRKYNRWFNSDKCMMTRPMPIEIYLRTAMSNFYIDFVKKINRPSVRTICDISIEESGLDYGYAGGEFTDLSALDDFEEALVINGVDVLQSLQGLERNVFILYLKGWNFKQLDKVFKPRLQRSCRTFINKQLAYLHDLRADLFSPQVFMKHFEIENNY